MREWCVVRMITCLSSVAFALTTTSLAAVCLDQDVSETRIASTAVGSAIVSVALCLLCCCASVDAFFFLSFFIIAFSILFGYPLGLLIVCHTVPSTAWMIVVALAMVLYIGTLLLVVCMITCCCRSDED